MLRLLLMFIIDPKFCILLQHLVSHQYACPKVTNSKSQTLQKSDVKLGWFPVKNIASRSSKEIFLNPISERPGFHKSDSFISKFISSGQRCVVNMAKTGLPFF